MYTGRTKKYAEAIIREGDKFDWWKWLRQVEEEEAQEKRLAAAASNSVRTTTPGAAAVVTAAEIPSQPKSPPQPLVKVNNAQTPQRPTSETILPDRKARKKKGFAQRLVHVSNMWDGLQETRDRDGVYEYLRAVFSIVQHYGWKGRVKKLLRHAFEFAELPYDKNADPFAVIIRCTCEGELDNKTISKWSRALRYVALVKKRTPLKEFMKRKGGINACASLYTERLRRGKR
jgi:hypothetical protein